jgi:hypothetical protein
MSVLISTDKEVTTANGTTVIKVENEWKRAAAKVWSSRRPFSSNE